MSDEKIEIVELKPKRKKKVEIEVGLVEETNPEAPQLLIEMDPVEPLQDELSPQPVVEMVEEKEIAPEPSVEPVERRDGTAGQGSWHGKHNLARQSKSPGARKYMPVHRQR